MSRPPQKLKDFLESFVESHALEDGNELLLDVTPEEARDLGMFFIRGLCGWMHGLNRVRRRRQLPRHEDQLAEDATQAVDEEVSYEADEGDALVN